MRVDIGTATASGVISDTNDVVVVIEFHARSDNLHSAYVGRSNVSVTNGRELAPGESFALNFALPDIGRHAGSVLFSQFYANLQGGDALDWAVIMR